MAFRAEWDFILRAAKVGGGVYFKNFVAYS